MNKSQRLVASGAVMAGAFTNLRKRTIDSGLTVLRASGLARAGEFLAGGIGTILMFHHVRPWGGEPFAPNRGLEIEPDFLDAVLGLLTRLAAGSSRAADALRS